MQLFEFPKRPKWMLLAILIPWTIGAFGMAGVVMYGIVEHPRWEIWPIPLLILLLATWGLRLVLWNLRGKQIVVINDERLVIDRSGSFLMPERSIELAAVEDVEFARSSVPWFLTWYGTAGGNVKVSYLGRSTWVGMDASGDEQRRLVDALKEVLREKT
jgi:hypothetical protein